MRIDQRLGAVTRSDDIAGARAAWDAFRVEGGYQSGRPLLTRPEENLKLDKATDAVTYGLSLAPARTSGTNVCPWSTPTCRAGCVAFSGNGRYDSVTEARILKTLFLWSDPVAFCTLVAAEIDRAREKHGRRLRVRLNTFSDVAWENVAPWLFTGRPRRHVRFYDYTKGWERTPPDNYRLTLSASEKTSVDAIWDAVTRGLNVAVVFPVARTQPLPVTWHGLTVIDGEKTDNRANDPRGVVVGLRAKGSLRGDRTGMVKRLEVRS